MSGPNNTRENEILGAIADTLVARTSIIAQTTLTQANAAGDTALYVVDAGNFTKNGYVHWFDNTGERMASINSVDYTANTITLNYSGYAEHNLPVGLVAQHAQGAIIATNLMLHKPMAISAMLRSNLPVVAMWPRKKDNTEWTVGSTQAPMVIRIQAHLALQQFDQAPMDSEAYNDLQQSASRDALQAIENALNQNRHLMSTYNSPGNHANGLGDGKNPQWAQSVWDTVVEDVDIPQAVGAIDVWVRPTRFVR